MSRSSRATPPGVRERVAAAVPFLLVLAAGCQPQPGAPVPPLYAQHLDQPFTQDAPQRVRTGNINYQGLGVDVVTVDQGGSLSVLWHDGPGRLAAPAAIDTGTTEPVVDATLNPFDLNSRGQIVALLPTEVTVLEYQGANTFAAPTAAGHLAPGSGYRDLLVGDFNNDGHSDLFIVGDTGSDLWLGPDFKAAQNPRPPALLPDPAPFVGGIVPSGGEGVVGMRQGPNGPELVALLGLPSGRFTVQVAPPLPTGDAITAIAPAHFANGSGYAVLVAGKGFLAIYPQTRDGVFGKPRLAKVDGLDPLAVAAGDVDDADYGEDIVVTTRDGKLLTFLSQASGGTEFVEAPPRTVGPSPTGLVLTDVYGQVGKEILSRQDVLVSTEGTCCPLKDASVQAFSGGGLTGSGVATVSFKQAP